MMKRVIGLSLVLAAIAFPSKLTAQREHAWSQQLTTLATQLTSDGNVHLTGDIECEYGPGDGSHRPAHTGSDATALLRVASQPTIFLYAHGFYRNPRRPKPPLDYVFGTWDGHLAVARSLGRPYAACLFTIDTSVGFGDSQSTIGDFLFALRAVTDDRELFAATRNVVLVGYSAGANYVKQGLVTYQTHLRANNIPPVGLARTPMTAVFLGGVHNGTEWSGLADAGVQLLNAIARSNVAQPRSYEEASAQRWNEYLRSEMEALSSSRGVRQLQRGNAELDRLNREFRAARPANLRIVNILSTSDFVAPAATSGLDDVSSELVSGLTHWDFVANPLTPKADAIATRVYGPLRH